jgi:SAM-dependent methyltransferase
MGISLRELRRVLETPRLQQRPLKVLDIGSQNLHGAAEADIIDFVNKNATGVNQLDLKDYAAALCLGANVDPKLGGMNGAWLGDILERVGIEYVAFDIFDGYRTTIFDLNEEHLKAPHRGAYDLVLNCGTTEHVLNQMNSFRVIHDATKVGGIIYHSLPMTGFLDHGYFNYNPRLFVELAQANSYVVRRLTYNGPHGLESMFDRFVKDYAGRIEVDRAPELTAEWQNARAPTASLSIVLEKTIDQPFRASLEISTTVGSVTQTVGIDASRQAELAEIQLEEEALLLRLDDPTLKATDIFSVYQRRTAVAPGTAFPLLLEKRVLELFIVDDPKRDDLKARLEQVKLLITARRPLLRFPASGALAEKRGDPNSGSLSQIATQGMGFAEAVDAYHSYNQAGHLAKFPLDLERKMLEEALTKRPDDPDLRVRLGQVLSALIPEMPLRRS